MSSSTAQSPITPRKPSKIEDTLIIKYAEDIAAQSGRMDSLAERMITLELAVPGLFATALKLIHGKDAQITPEPALVAAFVCWFVALLLTLIALIPGRWRVDESILREDRMKSTESIGIRDYFFKTARYKRCVLLPAVSLFFLGIVFAVWEIV